MAKKFLVNIDLSGNQLISPVIHPLTAAPTAYAAGQLYYNTTGSTLYAYSGGAWQSVGSGVTSLNSQTGAVIINGTANQVTATSSSGSITLSLPSTMIVGNIAPYGPGSSSTNVSVGASALNANTSGSNNVAVGATALANVTTGTGNTAVGQNALKFGNSTNNTAFGSGAMSSGVITGQQNTAIGQLAALFNTSGQFNVALGYSALYNNQIGSSNIAIGRNAMNNTSSAVSTNTAIGESALVAASANSNVAVGHQSLTTLTTGTLNAALGHVSGSGITTGNYNTFLNSGSIANTASALSGVVTIGRDSSNNAAVATANNDFILGTANHNVKVAGTLAATASVNFTGSVNLGTNVATGSVAYAVTAGSVTGATSTNTNSTYVIRDANGRAQFTDPSSAQDAATKNYVDTVAQGLNAHDAVQLATTANLTSTYTNGTTDASGGLGIGASLTATGNGILQVDGVNVATNDRILVKNQSTQTQNGIYYVSASGTASTPWSLIRSEDSNNSIASEMAKGDFIFVIAGSTQSSTGWVLNPTTTTGTPTGAVKIGTDNVTYSQFSGQGTYTASNGITINGNAFSVNAATTGGIQSLAGGVSILKPTNSGLITDATGLYIGAGTGFSLSGTTLNYATGTVTQTATGVTSPSTYSYGTQKQSATITGNSAATSFVIAHNLNSRDIAVQVYQTSATPDTQWNQVEVDVFRTATSSITVTFATAPATGDTYNVVIVG